MFGEISTDDEPFWRRKDTGLALEKPSTLPLPNKFLNSSLEPPQRTTRGGGVKPVCF